VPIPTGRSATNALSRALTLASKKLFGAGMGSPRSPPHFTSHAIGLGSSSPRMRTASMGGAPGEIDPVEDELLAGLEQLAQKTHVITRWADEMYEFVKGVPQSACLLVVLGTLARALTVRVKSRCRTRASLPRAKVRMKRTRRVGVTRTFKQNTTR
jgi:hypothetical protein